MQPTDWWNIGHEVCLTAADWLRRDRWRSGALGLSIREEEEWKMEKVFCSHIFTCKFTDNVTHI